MFPKKLHKKLENRTAQDALRTLGSTLETVDFSSNDYLGFSRSHKIFEEASTLLKAFNLEVNGATGSRLLTGNHPLYSETESQIAAFHKTEAALLFNSGYDANIGFFSSVPQRGDIIMYDELCHASIRDGIKMSHAKPIKFRHNDVTHIEHQLSNRSRLRTKDEEIYIVTESIFSMDGDHPDIKAIAILCKKYNAHLIVDEAHALGVMGHQGEGLVQQLGLEKAVFARIVTFGKALGCHGAAILGSKHLKSYLVNFARSFIYTTGLPPHSVATISAAYKELKRIPNDLQYLKSNIAISQYLIVKYQLSKAFIKSHSAIHSCVISGNEATKSVALQLTEAGFDVKPILSPTVPKGKERLRICLHSYNTEEQITQLIQSLSEYIPKSIVG